MLTGHPNTRAAVHCSGRWRLRCRWQHRESGRSVLIGHCRHRAIGGHRDTQVKSPALLLMYREERTDLSGYSLGSFWTSTQLLDVEFWSC